MKKTLKSLVVRNTNNTCEVFDTVSLLDRFIKFADISNSSIYTYTKSIRQLFKFFADNGIDNPTHDNIIEFKKYLVSHNKSAHTISLYISAIKKFFSWCEAEGLYKNITTGIKAPRIDKGHKKDAFSGEQIKEVMKGIDRNSLEGLRNYAILGLITTAGLRTIEVVRANIEDLRLNAGQPVLFVQGKDKSSKSDFVKLTPKVLRAIKAYLKARGNVKSTEPLICLMFPQKFRTEIIHSHYFRSLQKGYDYCRIYQLQTHRSFVATHSNHPRFDGGAVVTGSAGIRTS